MKLTNLQAEFVQYSGPGSKKRSTEESPINLSNADGVIFLCPLCFARNKGEVGAHMVMCWFVGKVPDDAVPGPGRWTPQGTGVEDLTFVPGTPPRAVSVALTGGCKWHGFVRDGDAT